MKKLKATSGFFLLVLTCFFISNFNAFAQKTNIFIVRIAEPNPQINGKDELRSTLSPEGQMRANDLLKALKHEKIKAIYVSSGKAAEQTAYPLAARAKILPRVYADSTSGLVKILNRNFQGTNVLVVAQLKDIMQLISQLGVDPPFETLNDDDYDLLFSITLNGDDKKDMFITYYGKPHHVTEIPQQYLIDKFYPSYTAPIISH
ncbi:histidine phosphatase family protein [Mucilaginibacter ximonensis]|uniref:Histidine phosphatase family protein n=1 Tax=Mucilaginibacter ximonensis TaxID=538021 RepID=A0ABW5YD96_9SPHI